jgi:arylsulfatase A-like enzyme
MARAFGSGSRSVAMIASLVPLLALAACRAEEEEREAERRPNVVFVLINSLRADRVGWSGGGTGLTPFLDGLAETSSVFWSAYAPSSSTSPVLASLFTSRFPSQHRVETHKSRLDRSEFVLAELLGSAGYATALFSANPLLNVGLGRGFDVARAYYAPQKQRLDRLAPDACDWLRRTRAARPEAPVFLFLHLMEAHEPWQPPGEALSAVAARRGADPKRLERLHELARSGPRLAAMSGEQLELARDLYDAEVAGLDAPLRAFFAELERLGILSNAIVLVTSDHGIELLDHGGRGFGHSLYEELIHVPLLVKRPGQTERNDVRDVVSLVDLTPTILAAAGIALSARFEGRSQLEALRGRSWLRRLAEPGTGGSAYSEMPGRELPGRHARALVLRSSKLIEGSDGASESYDLASDPGERRPHGLDPAALAPVRAELERQRGELTRSSF